MALKDDSFFLVHFRDPLEAKNVSLRVRSVTDSSLGLSFICLQDFVFPEGQLVINPQEEALQKRFEHVKSLHLSLYSVLSIEEVGGEHPGLSFDKDRSNLLVLPNSPSSET